MDEILSESFLADKIWNKTPYPTLPLNEFSVSRIFDLDPLSKTFAASEDQLFSSVLA